MSNSEKKSITIDEKTRAPLVWVFSSIAAGAGVVLYLSDLRSETRINTVKIEALEKRQDLLENNIRDELREINKKLEKLSEASLSRNR